MEKQYYTLSTDVIFKNTFNDEDSLKRLLEETLELKVSKILKNNIELAVDNRKERRKYLDLILETNQGIVNVEINHGYKDELPNRNLLYFCKLLSSSVKRHKRYVNVDYFEDVWYHGDIEKENPFLMLLAAPTEEKMDEISKGDNLMSELNDKVKKLNQDSDILDVIIENEDEIIANSMYEKGIEQGTEVIARKLLNRNMSIDEIVEITNLTKEEVEKISNN